MPPVYGAKNVGYLPFVQPFEKTFLIQFFHEAHIDEIFRAGAFNLRILLGKLVDDDLDPG